MRRTAAIALLALVPALTSPATSSYSGGVFDPAPYLGTRWYGVYLFGEKVGYGSFRLTETDYRGISGYLTELRIDYQLNLGGSLQEMAIREEKIYLPGVGLTAFKVLQDSLLGRVSFSGRREGEQFLVETPTGERMAPAAGETLSGALAHLELVRNGSGPGDAVTVRQFETTLLAPVTVTHTVETVEERFPGGVPLKLYRVRSEFPGLGLATSSLIDGELRTIEGNLGIITIREEEEAAARNLDSPGDLLLATAVRPDRPLPRPRKIRSLALRLTGMADPALALSSPRQEYEKIGEETYYLRVSSPLPLPDPPPRIPVPGAGFISELEATAYIQSDYPTIRGQALKIAGEEKDSRLVAKLLTEWVFHSLDKSFLAAIPNAVDVLEKRSGDCKAHSVLLVALARSLGLPARTVSGLVAMEDGLFYYHQWAEIFTGEWTPADPVFGQIPVDATHISLSRSGPAEQLRLLNLIGRIRIEVLEWRVGSGK